MPKKRLFCSRLCFQEYRKNKNHPNVIYEKKCKICRRKFIKPFYLACNVWEKRKFCSERCFGKSVRGKNSPAWVHGLSRTKIYRNYKTKQRYARKKGAKGNHTLKEWKLLKAQYGWTCPACKKREPKIKLTEDHIIPLTKGGSNNINNIQPLCRSCNSIKNNKIIKYEWIYSKERV